MASNAPPPSRESRPSTTPAGVPSGGNGKYVAIIAALVVVVGGMIAFKVLSKPEAPAVINALPEAGAPLAPSSQRLAEEDIPPPPPVEDAGSEDAGKKTVATSASNPCEAKTCGGSDTTELNNALSFRTKQAHRCYDQALAQDSTLRGKLTISVRVGSNGQACSASVASNEMGSPSVANCVLGYFRGQNFPAPKGGCADINIPINFVPR
jgi:hypothetical protein